VTEPPQEPLEPPTEVGPRPHSAQQPESDPRPEPRRLYRSRDDQVVAGVCGGIGEYFGIDAALVRIGFVLLIFAGGLGILAYVLGWIFVSEEPVEATHPATADTQTRSGALVFGLVFVALGVLFLFDIEWPDLLSWEYLWPIALIAVGAAIVLRARQ